MPPYSRVQLSPDLAVTGALNWDINLFVKHLPLSGQEVVVEKIDRVPGGKGGNVSVAASRKLGAGQIALVAYIVSSHAGGEGNMPDPHDSGGRQGKLGPFAP